MTNSWAAYQFDNAVVFTGITIENALQERVKQGSEENPRWENKYTIQRLLDPDFRLPLEDQQPTDDTCGPQTDNWMAMVGVEGAIVERIG